MKTVTPEQFKEFGPCWLETAAGRQRYARVAAMRDEWSALDVLALDGVSNKDKLWAVLREEFIDAPVLHEYACRCAEYALTFVREPDSRSIEAIEAKRKWLRGEISNDDLTAARAAADAAWAAADAADAAARAAACDAANAAARAAANAAARAAAWAAAAAADAADAAARAAADAADAAARAAAWAAADAADAAARAAACDAAWEHEIKLLKELLREVEQ